MIRVRVENNPFDCGVEIDFLGGPGIGAIASFVGIVRGDGGLVSLTLDHYPAMTIRALQELGEEASTRWSLDTVSIIHRVGTMAPGERIVFVGTSSAHRAAALDGCAFLIDALKTRAPFWKQERFDDGRSGWVEAREADDRATARWD
ncbi:molybdenum cofactor biosynthesis protein MoaE [Sphingomonas sp.]|uniref:molybdenum cofactor biosynthesis protein MoaE n=1 Tax=Sphingomonas sp. TaxID=28214 RepID=UPI0025EB7A0A|nr:molybdenum cofactor biosynthesis protein MoaE [Sphingomonas sp.]